jgi:hypothetical protein
MNKILISFTILFLYMPAFTQSVNPIGEYYLEGVMETASGLLIKPDSTFEFFYSYGALDRGGKGKWTLKDGMLILDSEARPEKDFALISSKKTADKNITIRIVEKNTNLLRYVECLVEASGGNITGQSNADGLITIEKSSIDNVSLIFTWCADRSSVFKNLNQAHNYFEFRFEPWICTVYFNKIELKIDQIGLVGQHPLLKGNNFRFRKASSKN